MQSGVIFRADSHLVSIVSYLIENDFESFVGCAVAVSPVVGTDSSANENLVAFLEHVPRDCLIVLLELFLEDYAVHKQSVVSFSLILSD